MAHQWYPAKAGKGVIAGGPVRMVVELAGLKDIVCKIHGSKNGHNVVRATMDGLSQLMTKQQCFGKRDLELPEVAEAAEAVSNA